MALFWFLLALVLLVVALVILRLDAKQRGGGSRGRRAAVGDRSERSSGEDVGGAAEGADAEKTGGADDDEAPHSAPPADGSEASDESAVDAGGPKPAPFQRAAGSAVAGAAAGTAAAASSGREDGENADAGAATGVDTEAGADRTDAGADLTPDADADTEAFAADTEAVADDEALAAATSSDEYAAPAGQPESRSAPESPVGSSPRLLDRVRALLPARRASGRAAEPVEAEPEDPLAGSPVVRWLEDREFAPTPTPAPEFRHGDFAGGLSALGTVSHGVFRGRRAIMGVTGGRTVLALRRDTASDVVLDLSRPDVDAEPGFHDAGQVGVLEARTSDHGRLDLLDRDRLADSVENVPASVRRIWAEGEWVAATIDGVDDPSGWDDVVMALHGAADVVAPFPPVGGRARALPAEIDPGAPAAAEGPEADPTMGMDGEVGTDTHTVAPSPDSEDHVVVDPDTDPDAGATDDGATATTAPTSVFPVPGAGAPGSAGQSGPLAKRAGHLRLVPDRPVARDLSDVPVTADRGDAPVADAMTGDATAAGPAAQDEVPEGTADVAATEDPAAGEPAVEEADPFAEIMESAGHVESRGDVAADHLEPRPPLSRPTRGAGQAYPEDATVPPLAARTPAGGAGIKPLGSEDDEDEIRDEVERFDAARIDGGSDFDESASGRHGAPEQDEAEQSASEQHTPEQGAGGASGSGGRHGVDAMDPSEVTQRLSVAELAERMGIDPSEMRTSGRRRRRRVEADEGEGKEEGKAPENGQERSGVDPDVERTTRLDLPPDIKD